ncbi:hypothetical protein TKK_0001447 [Trichogramma kaykai]|uniref:26S proteasome non-ATPase regulatory subunit 8 n=1 Tax=Trichogramma kaykai TaxID=54128 RepID=A0ABD2X306_9HYME
MAALNNLEAKCNVLKKEWDKRSPNLKLCGDMLKELKILLTQLSFLPTSDLGDEAHERELYLARDILEIGAKWSVANHDIPSFERYMAQLKNYYFDYKYSIKESMNMYDLLGLNLMFLLSQNRVAEFHTELELLPADRLEVDSCILVPRQLEQWLMEGSYDKIFRNAKGTIYSKNFFMDILLNTVRDEIGACVESAFDKISIEDAARMLNLNTKEIMQYCAKKNWTLANDGFIHFEALNEKKHVEPIPSADLATLTIDYARELEKIV